MSRFTDSESALIHAELTSLRIRIHYGDPQTGEDWGDVYGVEGTVGRSGGPIKIPILLHSRNSHGGGAILTDRIVRVRHANRRAGGDLYCHPTYAPPPESDHPTDWARHFAPAS